MSFDKIGSNPTESHASREILHPIEQTSGRSYSFSVTRTANGPLDLVTKLFQNVKLAFNIFDQKKRLTADQAKPLFPGLETTEEKIDLFASAKFTAAHPIASPAAAVKEEISPEAEGELLQAGLNQKEIESLKSYYATHKAQLDGKTEPELLRRGSGTPPLPRTIVSIPEGPRKGMYVLLKAHGTDKVIGSGSFNKATLAIDLKTGQKKIFRSARAEDVSPREIEANRRTADYPDHFAAGVPIHYQGPWRSRTDPTSNQQFVDKVGFIMDFIEGGELFDRLKQPPPSYL